MQQGNGIRYLGLVEAGSCSVCTTPGGRDTGSKPAYLGRYFSRVKRRLAGQSYFFFSLFVSLTAALYSTFVCARISLMSGILPGVSVNLILRTHAISTSLGKFVVRSTTLHIPR